MRSKTLLYSFGAALLCAAPTLAGNPGVVPAGGPCCPPPPCATPSMLPGTTVPGATVPGMQQPTTQQPGAAQAPTTDAFAQAPPTGGEAAQTALPNMVGDLGIYGVSPRISQPFSTIITVNQPVAPPAGIPSTFASTFPSTFNSSFSSSSSSSNSASNLQSKVPVTSFGSFKISDNESVQPVDRVFMTYNYYNVDGFQGNSSSINREVVGFEKAFLDGRASFGMRVPFTQVGENLGGTSDVDGLSFIGKYAFYLDRETGNVISGGLVVTVPTGPDIPLDSNTTVNPTLIQPWVGGAFNFGRFYVQGYSEIIISTDNNVPNFWGNDIGMGYRLESIPVVPIFEAHINSGLNHQGSGADGVGFIDSVVLTGGLHTLIGKSILTFGVATPVTGPRLDSVEAVVQFNCRF
jgi:hypothetical protein